MTQQGKYNTRSGEKKVVWELTSQIYYWEIFTEESYTIGYYLSKEISTKAKRSELKFNTNMIAVVNTIFSYMKLKLYNKNSTNIYVINLSKVCPNADGTRVNSIGQILLNLLQLREV